MGRYEEFKREWREHMEKLQECKDFPKVRCRSCGKIFIPVKELPSSYIDSKGHLHAKQHCDLE